MKGVNTVQYSDFLCYFDRFVITLPQDSIKSKAYFQVDDPEFGFDLISEVVKAFLASKPAHQDITAYALQELLKIYACKESSNESQGTLDFLALKTCQ